MHFNEREIEILKSSIMILMGSLKSDGYDDVSELVEIYEKLKRGDLNGN